MTYIALLRGINVGGNNKIEMKRLASTFEQAGMTHVRTYINSGNVIFRSESLTRADLSELLERAIESDFGLRVKLILRDAESVTFAAAALPADWTNDQATRCDVMFLWDEIDSPEIIGSLPIKAGIDVVKYVPGAVLWRVDRTAVTRSGMIKLLGTRTYKQMTMRNCNTVRKLAELVEQVDSEQE
jgi:uncharacterized protein (DUF1697 family)